jgi:hypothetical protein
VAPSACSPGGVYKYSYVQEIVFSKNNMYSVYSILPIILPGGQTFEVLSASVSPIEYLSTWQYSHRVTYAQYLYIFSRADDLSRRPPKSLVLYTGTATDEEPLIILLPLLQQFKARSLNHRISMPYSTSTVLVGKLRYVISTLFN